jgi:hypothetical protein
VKIRETTVADLPAALALNNSSIPALNELDAAEIERLLGMAALALTAEVDDAFAGFCITFPPGVDYASLNYGWFSRQYDDFIYLDRIAVDPAYRRYGIGRASPIHRRSVHGRLPQLPARSTFAPTRPRCCSMLDRLPRGQPADRAAGWRQQTVSLPAHAPWAEAKAWDRRFAV